MRNRVVPKKDTERNEPDRKSGKLAEAGLGLPEPLRTPRS